jgi:hypothetical protein
VKFAKTVPTAEDGDLALVRAEHIVHETMPVMVPGVPATPGAVMPGGPTPPPNAPAPVPRPLPADDPRSVEAREWGPKEPKS